MLPDRVSNPGPLTYESGALPIALRGPATSFVIKSPVAVKVKVGHTQKRSTMAKGVPREKKVLITTGK